MCDTAHTAYRRTIKRSIRISLLAQNRFPMDGKAAQENFREVLNRVKEHFPKK